MPATVGADSARLVGEGGCRQSEESMMELERPGEEKKKRWEA